MSTTSFFLLSKGYEKAYVSVFTLSDETTEYGKLFKIHVRKRRNRKSGKSV